jgi:hypothetical protein
MPALPTGLDLSSDPFFGKPCEPGFEGPSTGVVISECCVDAEWVADFEGFEVGFKGVTEEDGGWRWGCGGRRC